MSFSVSTYRRARKVHECAECGHDIRPGETYMRLAGATEGHGWSLPLCLACDGLHEAVNDVIHALRIVPLAPEDGPTVGDIVAWIEDADIAHELPPAAQGRYYGLLFAEREKACDERQRGYRGGLLPLRREQRSVGNGEQGANKQFGTVQDSL